MQIQQIKRQEREIATQTFLSKVPQPRLFIMLPSNPDNWEISNKEYPLVKPIVTIGYFRITNLTPFGLFRRKSRPSFSENRQK